MTSVATPGSLPPSRSGRHLRATGLAKAYRGRSVVSGVSLEVGSGEIVGLLGPNGAGKTTTFHIMVGLVAPDAGRIFLGPRELTGMPMYQRARLGIRYLPQEASVFRKLTVEQNLLVALEVLPDRGEERHRKLEALLDQFGLARVRRNPGYALSGGERRRVEIARGLVGDPAFMLLDEPFSGIDPIAVLDLQRIIFDLKRAGIGVLITDHNVRETLTVTDRAYIIHEGTIFRTGRPDELSRDAEVRRVYLGESFTLV